MKQFKVALKQYFVSQNKSCVMFERNFRSQHLQIQVLPIQVLLISIHNLCMP